MEENVNIAFLNGREPVPWATEATLLQIHNLLRGMQKNDKANDAALLSALRGSSEGNAEDFERLRQQLSSNDSNAEKRERKLSDALKSKDSKSNRDRQSTTSKIGETIKEIPGLGLAFDAIKLLGETLMASSTGYADAYKSGAIFAEMADGQGAASDAFINAATHLQIGFDDLANVSKNYAAALNQSGIEKFSKTTKDLSSKFTQFGLTTMEAADFTGSWIEQQRLLGQMDVVRSGKASEAASESFEVTKRFAQVLGKSTQDLMKQQELNMKSRDLQSALLYVNEQSKESFSAVMTTLDESGLGDIGNMIKQGIGDPAALAMQTMNLRMAGAHDAAEALEKFTKASENGTLNEKNREAMTRELLSGLSKVNEGDLERLRTMSGVGIAEAEQVQGVIALAKNLNEQFKMTATDTGDARLGLTKAWEDMKKALGSSVDTAFGKFFTDDTITMFSTAMQTLTNVIGQLVKEFQGWISGMGQEGLADYITGITDALREAPATFREIMDSLKILSRKLQGDWGFDAEDLEEENQRKEYAKLMKAGQDKGIDMSAYAGATETWYGTDVDTEELGKTLEEMRTKVKGKSQKISPVVRTPEIPSETQQKKDEEVKKAAEKKKQEEEQKKKEEAAKIERDKLSKVTPTPPTKPRSQEEMHFEVMQMLGKIATNTNKTAGNTDGMTA